MLVAMRRGSSRRGAGARSALVTLLVTGGLVAAALALAAAREDGEGSGSTVILYGDSLSMEAGPYFSEEMARTSSADVVTKPVPGAAPCDVLDTMRADAAAEPAVVVIQFVGNNATPCTQTGSGERRTGQELADQYAADVRTAAGIFAGTGTRVVLVGGPPAPGLPGGADGPIEDAYRRIAAAWDARDAGAVRYADAAATVTGPDRTFVARLPCAADEGPAQGCDGREVTVRSPDETHFCPAEGPHLTCPVPSPGARRFGNEMARVGPGGARR